MYYNYGGPDNASYMNAYSWNTDLSKEVPKINKKIRSIFTLIQITDVML